MAEDATPIVAVVGAGAREHAELGRELRELGRIRFSETGDLLDRWVTAAEVDVVVTCLTGHPNPALLALASKLHASATPTPHILCCSPTPRVFAIVPAALATGAYRECAVRGYDRLDHVVRTALAPSWQPGAEARLVATLVPLAARANLDLFVTAGALKASPRLSLERVAAWIEIPERTLRGRVRRIGVAGGPSALLARLAALHAVWRLAEQNWEPHRVAAAMGYLHIRALNRSLREYAGHPAALIRQRGDFGEQLQRMTDLLRGVAEVVYAVCSTALTWGSLLLT